MVAFYQLVYSLVLDYDIQDLKKAFPYFGEFMFLHVALSLLDGTGESIVFFDVAVVVCLYFGLNDNPCAKYSNGCFGQLWNLVVNYNVIVCRQILAVL